MASDTEMYGSAALVILHAAHGVRDWFSSAIPGTDFSTISGAFSMAWKLAYSVRSIGKSCAVNEWSLLVLVGANRASHAAQVGPYGKS